MTRTSGQILAGSFLQDHSVVEHGDTIAEGESSLDVVGYEKKRESLLRLHRLQKLKQLF